MSERPTLICPPPIFLPVSSVPPPTHTLSPPRLLQTLTHMHTYAGLPVGGYHLPTALCAFTINHLALISPRMSVDGAWGTYGGPRGTTRSMGYGPLHTFLSEDRSSATCPRHMIFKEERWKSFSVRHEREIWCDKGLRKVWCGGGAVLLHWTSWQDDLHVYWVIHQL
jgi:hypothetical protein